MCVCVSVSQSVKLLVGLHTFVHIFFNAKMQGRSQTFQNEGATRGTQELGGAQGGWASDWEAQLAPWLRPCKDGLGSYVMYVVCLNLIM